MMRKTYLSNHLAVDNKLEISAIFFFGFNFYTYLTTFFLLVLLRFVKSVSLPESESDSASDSSSSDASSILVQLFDVNVVGSDDAVSLNNEDVFGRCNGV